LEVDGRYAEEPSVTVHVLPASHQFWFSHYHSLQLIISETQMFTNSAIILLSFVCMKLKWLKSSSQLVQNSKRRTQLL